MRVLVCVKHVPVDVSTAQFDATFVTDRADVLGQLSAADVEALRVAVLLGADEVIAATMGPAPAARSLAQARTLGADRLVHVVDSALVGSDTAATSLVLATLAQQVEADLVLMGVATDDGASGFVPPQVASRLVLPLLGRVGQLRHEAGTMTGIRDEGRPVELSAGLPAVASVLGGSALADGIEPAEDAGAVTTRWVLRDLDISPEAVGRANAWTRVESVMPLGVQA